MVQASGVQKRIFCSCFAALKINSGGFKTSSYWYRISVCICNGIVFGERNPSDKDSFTQLELIVLQLYRKFAQILEKKGRGELNMAFI